MFFMEYANLPISIVCLEYRAPASLMYLFYFNLHINE